MANRKIRLIVEIDIDNEVCEQHRVKPKEIFDGICMEENEVVNSFDIFVRNNNFTAYDCVLKKGHIVSKELM